MYSLPSSYNKDFLPKSIPYGSLDIDTKEYCDRLIVNNGTVLRDYEIIALNYLIKQYKYYRLWDKLISYFPLLGGTGALGSKQNFQVNLIKTSPNLIYGGALSDASCIAGGFRNVGGTSNGSTSYIDSGILHSTLDLENVGMSYYCRTEEIKSSIADMGVLANNNIVRISLYSNYGSIYKYASSEVGSYLISSAQASSLKIKGYWSCNKIGQHLRLSHEGNIIANSIGTDRTSLAGNIYLGSMFRIGVGAVDLSTRTYGMFAIHKGYTPNEEKIRGNIEQEFQRLLNRAV